MDTYNKQFRIKKLPAQCVGCGACKDSCHILTEIGHVLNILLGFDEDYHEIKNKACDIFLGPDSLDIWGKLLEDPE